MFRRLLQGRRFLFSDQQVQRRIDSMMREANAAPNDPYVQLRLFRALNSAGADGSRTLLQRVEAGRYLHDEAAAKEYLKALVATGRLEHANLSGYKPTVWSSTENMSTGPSTAASPFQNSAVDVEPKFVRLDPGQPPLTVQVSESPRAQVLKVVKGLLGTLIVVSGLSVLVESLAGNINTRLDQMNSGKKIEPVENVTTRFSDVKGAEEVKDELLEIIEYLKNPQKFARLGAKLPKGVLLSGPPGVGKTLIARAIAGEANCSFLQASGSEFEEMFVGVGARRIRDLFAAARKLAPCIVFIDEIDAVGGKRSVKDTSSVRMTLNQLLIELDGFEENSGVVVVCATNYAESLDKALTRPGRLDKVVTVPYPDLQGRKEILEFYGSRVKLESSVDLNVLAQRSVGMTGADLANIVNIAAIRAGSLNYDSITMDLVEEAFDRIVLGLERKSAAMNEDERRMTAFHEAGHAIVGWFADGALPVQKATIIPRGSSLGVTYSAPDKDTFSEKLYELEARLMVAMGGRVAEELIYGDKNVSGGCASDLRSATAIARAMVMRYGMSPATNGTPGSSFLQFVDSDDYFQLSEETKSKVDSAVDSLLASAYARTKELLLKRKGELQRLAEGLIEFETLNRQEMETIIAGKAVKVRKTRQDTEERRKKEQLIREHSTTVLLANNDTTTKTKTI
jgi:ATP-dependent metalloprotease FtsH